MNKTDLTKVVKETVSETLEGVTAKDTAVFVDATIKAIQDTVVAGEKVSIAGFGTFETVERAARKARNPQTGEKMTVPAYKAPKFKASKTLKDAVKNA